MRQQVAFAGDDSPLDGPFEFAHVAGPIVAHEHSQCRFADPKDLFSRFM